MGSNRDPGESRFKAWLGRKVSTNLIRRLIALKDLPRFTLHYGDFHLGEDFRALAIGGVPNESGQIRGEMVKFLQDIRPPVGSLLLPGETKVVKPIFARLLDLPEERIRTAGLAEGMDWYWDFEQPPPDMGRYDCILSQAMLEHLVDPYKHMRDLRDHLAPGGHLIAHSVLPGFTYHRYPVDCMRFFPDWFEEVGKRLGLNVVDKFIGRGHITYKYRLTDA